MDLGYAHVSGWLITAYVCKFVFRTNLKIRIVNLRTSLSVLHSGYI